MIAVDCRQYGQRSLVVDLHGVEQFLVALVALVLADEHVQLVDQLRLDLFEVATVALFAVEHVKEDGQRGAPELRFGHERHLQEGADHARNEVDLVVADGVPHVQNLETHLDAHVALVTAQHLAALAVAVSLQLQTRVRQKSHGQIEVAAPQLRASKG